MTSVKSLLLAGTACALMATPALAQSAPEPAPSTEAPQDQAPPPKDQTENQTGAQAGEEEQEASTVGDIEVRATSTTPRTSIDAISYSLADDLQTTTGTLADALRNVPAVEVDPDGNVSLRGNQSVTILVDGRPSPLFSGASRAQLIQQLPADQYARIEVMTNPSAAYSAEGSGGIINLITKPKPADETAKLTQLGSIRVNVGEDRHNLGVNYVRTQGKLTLNLNAGLRRDAWRQNGESTTVRRPDAVLPELTRVSISNGHGHSESGYVGGNAQYRFTDTLQLSGNLFFTDISNPLNLDSRTVETDPSGTVTSAFDYLGQGEFEGQFGVGSLTLLKSFDDQGHEWSNELRLHRFKTSLRTDLGQEQLVPDLPFRLDSDRSRDLTSTWGFTSAYVRPMSDGSKLRAGYELDLTDMDKDVDHLSGPSLDQLVRDPRVSNSFGVQQSVHALYATYERPYGDKLSAQYGLRLEQTDREVEQITSGTRSRWDDLALYPTLHLSYQLTDQQSLRGSYSRRIERPRPDQLNPYLVYGSPTHYSIGNPDLRPQETDSFELMWQRRVQQTFYQATLYFRDSSGAFTTVTSEIEPGIYLSRPENLGSSRSTGLELVANGRLHPKLRYNASLNYAHIEIDATGLPLSQDRSGESLSGRVTLNWQPTDRDFVQVAGIWSGKKINAQGETTTEPLFNLGYRRKINEDWSIQLTARDLMDTYGTRSVTRTPDFTTISENTHGGRAVFVGFTWNFGQGPRRPEQFDFSAPQTGG